MCSYKLCRVEFRYWGLQSRVENFVHSTAIKKTTVLAHKQVISDTRIPCVHSVTSA